VPFDWPVHDAVLFDLDGVLTPTAEVHMQAWSQMFNAFLSSQRDQAPYTDADYFTYVDGKPRNDGVRDFLTARGIELPVGADDDPPSAETIKGLGNRKNEAFNLVLERDGVTAYPGSVALLDHLHSLGIPLAVVSSSANARAVLEAAGLADRFQAVVSGDVARAHGLPGKPAPDTFVYAAERLGATAATSVIVEDAVSGVRAGRAGDFAVVIGVDRGAGESSLIDAGADLVVEDLAELVPQEAGG
jgi:beta-phosphoglucomutase family hydrolase